jgi:uncharacterized protein (DUF433 family)
MSAGEAQTSDFRERIVVDPAILAGKPVIKGTHVTVSMILGLVAHGVSFDEILEDYPELSRDDIRAAILYADSRLED